MVFWGNRKIIQCATYKAIGPADQSRQGLLLTCIYSVLLQTLLQQFRMDFEIQIGQFLEKIGQIADYPLFPGPNPKTRKTPWTVIRRKNTSRYMKNNLPKASKEICNISLLAFLQKNSFISFINLHFQWISKEKYK